MRSAIVLVGGEARRANGQEKYFFVYAGRTFIERLTETLGRVTDETILVARDPEQCGRFSHIPCVRCISDIRKGIGPIGGLHAGALAAKGDLVFVTACDMPCVNAFVVSLLFDLIGNADAAIPCWSKEMFEPLHAVYRRCALLSYLESHDSFSLRAMIQSLNTTFIPVEKIKEFDPSLETFTNINRPDDLAALLNNTDEQ
jgi:molybdopterin-guanine dinucleotide biosynthesis protein A